MIRTAARLQLIGDFFRMHLLQDGGLSGRVLSVGEGIERETIHLAFDKYRKEPTKWFIPRSDAYSTIATSQSLSPHFDASVTRLESLSVLGALTGLMLVYGVAPTPLSPALVQFLLQGCDLQSLTPAFLQEWFPSLYLTLKDWISIGVSGEDSIDLFDSHFQLFHDFPVLQLPYSCFLCYSLRAFLNRFRASKTAMRKLMTLLQRRCCIGQPLARLFLRTQKWQRS